MPNTWETRISSRPAFEFEAIANNWNEIKVWIHTEDLLSWNTRTYRRCLVPKHRFGFRISTHLDPVDFLIYTALIYDVGEKLEACRVPVSEQVVHSYRFKPNSDGRMFSDKATYTTFQQASHDLCKSFKPKFVVIADIADFFPRLYTHRIDNALDVALGIGHMHCVALKRMIGQWAGTYSYGIPVGSAASRLVAETTIADIDQLLLSEGAAYLRYSDDFRIFCRTEAQAYKYLTVLARGLIESHGLTLQQNKTRIVSAKVFRSYYLRENEKREIDTLSEKFFDLLEQIGIEDIYQEIDYDALVPEFQKAIDQLNLQGILEEQINEEEPDLSLLKFILRRLSQLGDTEAIDLIFNSFDKFVPVVREAINYIMSLSALTSAQKKLLGEKLIEIYGDASSSASHLEYSRMYLLRPFAVDAAWNSDGQYVRLYNEAVDQFTRRELLLAMGKGKKAFWFRSRKQTLDELSPGQRTAFLYGASCLPADEYKHWILGINGKLDVLERAITRWAREFPIGQ